MSSTNYSFPEAVYIKPDTIPCNIRIPPQQSSRMEISTTYVNMTRQTVYILSRDGVTTAFPPSNNIVSSSQRFEIYKRINYIGVNFNIPTLLDGDCSYQQSIDKAIFASQAEFDNSPTAHKGYSSDRYLQFGIETSDLLKQKSIYVTNLDIVVTIEHPGTGITHPLTLHGDTCSLFHSAYKQFDLHWLTSINLMLVDNEFSVSKRYINISGKVVRITPISDKTRPSGLYIFNMENGAIEPPKIYGLDELDKSGIMFFNTYEEAISGGDPKAIFELAQKKELTAHKLEIEQREQELKTTKYENEKAFMSLKQKIEMESLEFKVEAERKINEFKHNEMDYRAKIQDLEKENLTFKRDSERRAQRRKETIEELKWAAGILAAVLTAAGVIIKHLKTE